MLPLDELVRTLALEPHPEGGFYRETYRSSVIVDTPRGPRPASTAIHFLVPGDTFSALHRIASDEVWHHHAGAPLRVVQLDEHGARIDHLLGTDLARGQRPQAVVPAGAWFGAHVEDDGAWSLVGCTVAPGFDFADFELGDRDALLARFPQHAELVRRLTREG
ncbi:MAG: cupin domain-containing protein [Myxococcota bacterium]|nr:cupin domain-containing protein [Myxococcota bacterium]